MNKITLQDGRILAWHEFGEAAGQPCLFFPGSSSSGLAGRGLDASAKAAGIRLLAIDRPGLGHSDPAPTRTLADVPDDIRELLDEQGIQRVGVLAHSAGGATALALNYRLPERVTATVIGAGSGPYSEEWFRAEAEIPGMSRAFYGLALRAPRVFGAVLQSSTPRTAKAIDRTLGLIARGDSPDSVYARTHPDETRAALEAVADGFRQGSRGPTDDARLICRPWGFRVEDVTGHVEWWHGEQDANVRPAAGRAITSRLPDVTAHFVDGGHFALLDGSHPIWDALRRS
ncbi:alpha/beta fold hydrolase [Sinomonas sp. P47F7]|uniref:alpha/beta fold hydrolase n=1 Tax=Sinomonas sp. P47F7 TaxID=3410987 RepID=UPI003BF4E847